MVLFIRKKANWILAGKLGVFVKRREGREVLTGKTLPRLALYLPALPFCAGPVSVFNSVWVADMGA
jgi:hypothetical protein